MSVLPKPGHRYCYADYRSWPEELRGELIGGVFYDMSPAPSVPHQRAVGGIYEQLKRQLRGKTCRPFIAPIDVLLGAGEESVDATEDVVQPDVLVVCDPAKIGERFIRGAPDFVAEVLSPSTAGKDQVAKLALYEAAGVREVWLLHPVDRVLTIYTRPEPGARYGRPQVLVAEGRARLAILPEVEIDLDEVFEA